MFHYDDQHEQESYDFILLPPENACDNVTDEDSDPDERERDLAPYGLRSIVESNTRYDDINRNEESSAKKLKHLDKMEGYHWRKNTDIDDIKVQWGSAAVCHNSLTPSELFFLFFDDEVFSMIVHYTNMFAAKKNLLGDVTISEMKVFFAILLLSGYIDLPRKRMYWETSADMNFKLVFNAMSRDRFSFIMSHLHVCDNDELRNEDKYGKVRPLFDALNARFRSCAPHKEHHSISETSVPYSNRYGRKQYIKTKPIRYWFKLWTGATHDGYVIWSSPYQGMRQVNYDGDFGLAGFVVFEYTKVLRTLSDQPYFLYLDHCFTSVPLLRKLKAMNFRASGVIKESLVDCPVTRKSDLEKQERGAFSYASSGDVIVAAWNDKSVITVASNARPVHPLKNVARFSEKENKRLYIPQPYLIQDYNQHIGGADRSNQNVSAYRISIRGKKWYSCLLQYLMDLAENNAWYLHKENGGKLDHLAFRRNIVVSVLESNMVDRYRQCKNRPPTPKSMEVRFDREDHWVIPQEKQTRCGLCGQKTTTRCEKCDKGVHVKCFKAYHT